ncbi:MAG: hypothetical protein DRI37_02030 [Chloroflexi bacterium]|nr:MAG: hypothetical protein DRI37_02030 [Chloroflexota bacterium]
MTIDYAAQALGKVSTLIEQLTEQERLVEKAKRERNKDERKQAERKVQSLHSDLLKQTDASLVYLYLKATETASDVDFRSEWQKGAPRVDALAPLKRWGIESLYKAYWATPTPDLTILPPYSFSLRFTFKLAQPYLSKDDNAFYIVDNPIVRDKVLRLPLVRPSGWKGALRAALVRELASDFISGKRDEEVYVQMRLQLYRLFGNEKDCVANFLNRAWAQQRVGSRPENESQREKWEQRFQKALTDVAEGFERKLRDLGYRIDDVEGFQGRLHFYPTYFTQIGLEVLNPHPRATGAGTNPILFECVPQGAEGTFTLLYVPLDGADAGESLADLATVAEGVQAMMTLYGFGAKTSSGFGLAEEEVKKGALAVAMADPQPAPAGESESPAENPLVQLEADMADFVHRFQLSDFPRWTNAELTTSGWGRKRQSKYKRLRRRHPDWNESTRTWGAELAAMESPPEPVEAESPLTSRDFDSLASLVQQIRELAQAVAEQPGGAQ